MVAAASVIGRLAVTVRADPAATAPVARARAVWAVPAAPGVIFAGHVPVVQQAQGHRALPVLGLNGIPLVGPRSVVVGAMIGLNSRNRSRRSRLICDLTPRASLRSPARLN